MNKYYFTFCCGIDDPHRNCYIVIEAENEFDARTTMNQRWGRKWAFVYRSAETAGVEKFNLKEIK